MVYCPRNTRNTWQGWPVVRIARNENGILSPEYPEYRPVVRIARNENGILSPEYPVFAALRLNSPPLYTVPGIPPEYPGIPVPGIPGIPPEYPENHGGIKFRVQNSRNSKATSTSTEKQHVPSFGPSGSVFGWHDQVEAETVADHDVAEGTVSRKTGHALEPADIVVGLHLILGGVLRVVGHQVIETR
jgi:hypothetical protein